MHVVPSLCGGCVFVQAHRKDGGRPYSQAAIGEQTYNDPTVAAARQKWRGMLRPYFRTEPRKVIRRAQYEKSLTLPEIMYFNALGNVRYFRDFV